VGVLDQPIAGALTVVILELLILIVHFANKDVMEAPLFVLVVK
jgi:hypothetical protein